MQSNSLLNFLLEVNFLMSIRLKSSQVTSLMSYMKTFQHITTQLNMLNKNACFRQK